MKVVNQVILVILMILLILVNLVILVNMVNLVNLLVLAILENLVYLLNLVTLVIFFYHGDSFDFGELVYSRKSVYLGESANSGDCGESDDISC